MHRPQLKFVGLIAVVFVVGVVAWSLFAAKPPVSMKVTGLVTNRWHAETIAIAGGPETYVRATVAVTNQSARLFSYWTQDSKESVIYGLEKLTSEGWAPEPQGFLCGTGMEAYTLKPGEGFTFEAIVKRDEPCKVRLSFTDVQKSNSIWQRLPQWMLEWIPWANPWHTVTTDAIDPREPRS